PSRRHVEPEFFAVGLHGDGSSQLRLNASMSSMKLYTLRQANQDMRKRNLAPHINPVVNFNEIYFHFKSSPINQENQ
ncbi:MAG TPA: hypothetical protein PLE00_05040, partial [Anaerolineaceae bacterium]|nr:hypothetical protein [Anaerolineaceae bacterium]